MASATPIDTTRDSDDTARSAGTERGLSTAYEQWSANGAEFVTPPIDRGAEIRCYMRDSDGYLIEVGQAT